VLNKKTKLLSPGELKRLSIAEEMVHGPKLLFVDEPTTGVNIEESSVLLQTFRELVNQDRTVVTTIHQPSAEIFKLFDTLLLLSKGRVIYFGPVNGATKFFYNSPFQFSYTNYTNPGDFLADVSGSFISDSKGDFIEASLLENYYMQGDIYNKLRLRFKPAVSTSSITSNPLYGAASSRKNPLMRETNSISLSSNPDQDGLGSVEIETNADDSPSKSRQIFVPAALVALYEVAMDVCTVPSAAQLSDMLFKGGVIFHRASLALVTRVELVIASTVLHVLLAVGFGWIIGDASGSAGVYNVTSFLAMSSMFLMLANIQFVFYVHNNHQVRLVIATPLHHFSHLSLLPPLMSGISEGALPWPIHDLRAVGRSLLSALPPAHRERRAVRAVLVSHSQTESVHW
jgi:hypothetical protein